MMQTSDQGIIALMLHEGIVPAPYLDSVGVWTYGVGHTKFAGNPDPAKMVRGMPADLDGALLRVFEVFRIDLRAYEREVNAAFSTDLTQAQFDAAVSFHYNTGAIGRASWVKKFNKGDFAGACIGIMNWRKPKEIIPRRESEQKLFQNGIYPTGKITVWTVTDKGKVVWRPAKVLTPREALALFEGAGVPDVEDPKPPKKTLLARLWRWTRRA